MSVAFRPDLPANRTVDEELLDLSWVLPNLALGGRLPGSAAGALLRLGIRRVLDLREEDRDDEERLRSRGITLLHVPIQDFGASVPWCWTGVLWINRQLDGGERVYVHCEHGIGRSAVVACAVLVSRGWTPSGALEAAKRARAKISPSPGQLATLLQWSAEWCRVTGRPEPAETVEKLTRIAYRPVAPG